ncbi:MAG: hypothetical protein R2713_01125 [Ilumatobacteraceae bacterium]
MHRAIGARTGGRRRAVRRRSAAARDALLRRGVPRHITDEQRRGRSTPAAGLHDVAARVAQSALDQTRTKFLAGLDSLDGRSGEVLGADVVLVDAIDLERHVLRPIGTWINGRRRRSGIRRSRWDSIVSSTGWAIWQPRRACRACGAPAVIRGTGAA